MVGIATATYIPAVTGGVKRGIVAKLGEIISVKDFDAKGDGGTNDTAAVQAAANAVKGTNKTLLIPDGTYKCGPLDFLNVRRLVCEGWIASTATSGQTAALIGTASNANLDLIGGSIELKLYHNSNSNAGLTGTVGIAVRGAAHCRFPFLRAQWFETGIDLAPIGGVGTQYIAFNQFEYLGTYGCLNGLRINPAYHSGTDTGWINENKFLGASLSAQGNSLAGTQTGVYMGGNMPSDNNIFIGFHLEGHTRPIYIQNGVANSFINPRLESAGNIVFGDGTTTSTCGLNSVVSAYTQLGDVLPAWTHSAWAPNFVGAADGVSWEEVGCITYDGWIQNGTTYYNRDALRTIAGATNFTSVTLNSSLRSWKTASERCGFFVPVKTGDVFRVTLEATGTPSGTDITFLVLGYDSSKNALSTLSAGQLAYLGTSNISSYANGSSGVDPHKWTLFGDYGSSRFVSVNRSEVKWLEISVGDVLSYVYFRVERMISKNAGGDAAQPNWPQAKYVSSFSTAPDGPGQVGIIGATGATRIAGSHTAWDDRGVVSVKDYGAVGNDTADDTAAIQAAVNTGAAVYFPGGTYKITAAIAISGTTPGIDQRLYGESYKNSIIHIVGAGVNGVSATGTLGRVTIENLQITGGTTTGHAIYLNPSSDSFGNVIRNVKTDTGGSAIYARNLFSTIFENVQGSSETSHVFDIYGDVGDVMIECYAKEVRTAGKAGFRLWSGCTLIACNGINTGQYWGIFGATNGADALLSVNDGVDVYPSVTLIGCNLEDFSKSGIYCKQLIGTLNLSNCTFFAPATSTFDAYMRAVGTITGGMVNIDGGSISSKGATRNLAGDLTTTGHTNVILRGRADIWNGQYRSDLTTLYNIPKMSNSGFAFGVTGLDINYAIASQGLRILGLASAISPSSDGVLHNSDGTGTNLGAGVGPYWYCDGQWHPLITSKLALPTAFTSNTSVPALQCDGRRLTNTGASATVTLTLPAATRGLRVYAERTAAQIFRIDPNGSEIISGGAAGTYLELGAVGSHVFLECMVPAVWSIVACHGAMTRESPNGSAGWGISSPTQVIDAAAYGVIADGSTNNATALMNMRTDMAATDRPWHVYFPPGEVRYSDPRWICNVKNVTLHCYGTSFTNTQTGGSAVLNLGLWNGDIWEDAPLTYSGSATVTSGYLFNDANIGATTITCTTVANAGNFAAGNRVLLHYYDQQFANYPANARFFEWNEVVSANAGTGALVLRRPLQFNYRNATGNNAGGGDTPACGKPRVMQLDKSAWKYANSIEIRGAKWNLNTVNPSQTVFELSGYHVKLVDCDFAGEAWVVENHLFEMINCRVVGQLEGDKIVRSMVINNCSLEGPVIASTGCDNVIIEECRIHRNLNIAPKNLVARRNTFHLASPTANAGLVVPQDGFSIESCVLEDNTIYSDTRLDYLISNYTRSLTIGSVSGTQIRLDNTVAANKQHMGAIRIGTELVKDDITKFGRVTAIGDTGAGSFTIDGTWPAPVAAETWYYSSFQHAMVRNNRCPNGQSRAIRNFIGTVGTGEPGGVTTFRFTSREYVTGSTAVFEVLGKIVAVRGACTRVYTGPQSGIQLIASVTAPSFAYLMLMHVTNAVQYAESSMSGSYKSEASSTVNQITAATAVCRTMTVDVSNGGGTFATGTAAQMPHWWLEFDVMSMS